MHGRRTEILHEQQLFFRVAGAGRDHQAADFLRAVMHDQRAGKQAVGHHVLQGVPGGHPRHRQAARHQLRGIIHIPPRKKQGFGLAGRAARSMQPGELVSRQGDQAARVGRPQIGTRGERQPPHIVQRLNIARFELQLGEFLLVKRHGFTDPADGRLQTLKLQLLQRGTLQGFNRLVPKHAASTMAKRPAFEKPE